MSYHLYQTEALIVRGSAHREADRFIHALTEEFGLIAGTATGVRLEKSKLRYALQDFSLVNLSLIRGKGGWRITNAALIESFFETLRGDRRKLALAARILALLSRLVAGEEAQRELFSLLLGGLRFLAAEPCAPEFVRAFEPLMVLRMLSLLGYIQASSALDSFSAGRDWNPEILRAFAPHRAEALVLINAALRSSHL